ncbi:histidine phosphatase family protein [Vibrio nigripulchritudo]|uniref:histidine phosphatase family protein n=1 Tax=Vibrio nigripulchritudo TaxID=28173 RepID=UPI0005FA5B45|nr:histidine phosphatase family protein [Vibrio nigripulchritudo]KJY79700.1 alpha-ribazole phosphatase [Vibrio nigripulchritudo]
MSYDTYNIYLIRHGKVEGEPALNGLTEAKVSDEIQAQIAQSLVSEFGTFKSIICSPLSRCLNLAKLISSGKTLSELDYSTPNLVVESAFQEMSFGDLDGRPFSQLSEQWNLLEKFWQDPASNPLPNAETLEAFQQRVDTKWQSLIHTCQEDTHIITHGGVIRIILASVLGLDWRNPALYSTLSIANASITHIELSRGDQVFLKVRSIGANIRK